MKKLLVALFCFSFSAVLWASGVILFEYPKQISVAELFHSTGVAYTQDNVELLFKRNPRLHQSLVIPANTVINFPFIPSQKMFWNYDLIKSFDGNVKLELRRIFEPRGKMVRSVTQQEEQTAKEMQNSVVKKRFKRSDFFAGASLRYALVKLTDLSSGSMSEISSRMNWSIQTLYTLYSNGRFTLTAHGNFTKYSFFPAQYKESRELAFPTYDVGGSIDYYLSDSFKLSGGIGYKVNYIVETPNSTRIEFSTYGSLAPFLGVSYIYEGKAHFLQFNSSLSFVGSGVGNYSNIDSYNTFSIGIDYRPNVLSQWKPNFKLGMDFDSRNNGTLEQNISEIHLGLYFLTSL